jgi:hypothetical protein
MGLEIFYALMCDPRFVNVPKLLEVPERDAKSYATLELLRRLRSETVAPVDHTNVVQIDLFRQPIEEFKGGEGAVAGST